MPGPPQQTGCVISGGGPAGMVLGLLLARAGVQVTVLEKHADFLRDFRGDTVHPSTLTLLDELGLSEQFDQMPHRDFDKLSFTINDQIVQFADFSQLNWPHKCVRMVPQWDFLNLLAKEAANESTFHLAMETTVTGLIKQDGRVVGVRYQTRAGETGEIRAALTVGCDGRHSKIRIDAGLPIRETPVPVDAWWFTLARNGDTDLEGGVGRFYPGHMFVMQDRGDYWQVAYFFQKGTNTQRRTEPITIFQEQIAKLMPWVADGVKALKSWDDIPFLDVRVNRLRRWYAPGVLCIGDAAHAMSPAGGPGVNLAVQDAVASARVLAPALLRGTVTQRDLAKIQSRRAMPAMVIQTLQRVLHATVFVPVLEATGDLKMPLLAKLIMRYPFLRKMPARMIGIGPRPEHAPAYARRPAPVP